MMKTPWVEKKQLKRQLKKQDEKMAATKPTSDRR